MANYGFVYLMDNDSMPGVYKIGYTDRPPMYRRDELSSSTSVPTCFEIVFYIECENASLVEKDIHEAFDEFRISSNREFFKFDIKTLMQNVYIYFSEEGTHFAEGAKYGEYSYQHHLILQKEEDERKNKLLEIK